MHVPRPSTVIAAIALFAALGGTATAAVTLGRDSVGAREIKRAGVSSSEIRDRSVRVRDLHRAARPPTRAQIAQVAEDTMTSSEVLDALRGAVRGESGAPGAQGERGPAGPGIQAIQTRQATSGDVAPGQTASWQVRCEAGERVLGGGGALPGATLLASIPLSGGDPEGWQVDVRNDSGSTGRVTAYALCVRVG